ncbi:MAG: ATP synthase F0 subunit B [bacterium]|nr:ATP synthase F0 subunit B [bacterium]
MKNVFQWILVLLCALAFTLIVDVPTNKFGIPTNVVKVLVAVNLTVFLYLLARLIGRPMAGFLEERRETVGKELSDAADRLREAEAFRQQADERLREVEKEIEELRQRAQREGESEAKAILLQAEDEEQRILRRIDDELARRQVETRRLLAQETAELTAQLTRQLLERELTDADRKRILDRSLTAMPSPEERG